MSISVSAAKIRLLQLDAEINQILSDPNAILKPSTLALPATASSVFVPSSFASIIPEGIPPAAPSKPQGVVVEKNPSSTKNSRGAAVTKVASKGASPPAANSSSWSLKGAAPQAPFEEISGTAALSKKKAQASAAAAAAVKQMEQFSSVRM